MKKKIKNQKEVDNNVKATFLPFAELYVFQYNHTVLQHFIPSEIITFILIHVCMKLL